MIIIEKVTHADGLICEIVNCWKMADLKVWFEDGGEDDECGYICNECHDEHIEENKR